MSGTASSQMRAASVRRATRRKSEDPKVLLAALARRERGARRLWRRRRARATRRARRDAGEAVGHRSTSGSWIRARRRSRAWSRATATAFEAQHPGTKVNIQFVPWTQAHDKFTTAIAGGKTPDVAEMGTTWTPEFADEGAFEQVAKPAERPVPLERCSTRRRSTASSTASRGTPARARSSTARTSSTKAGVKPPTTWDELAGGRPDDQGQGPGHLPVRPHRPDRAHVPADDLAGRR